MHRSLLFTAKLRAISNIWCLLCVGCWKTFTSFHYGACWGLLERNASCRNTQRANWTMRPENEGRRGTDNQTKAASVPSAGKNTNTLRRNLRRWLYDNSSSLSRLSSLRDVSWKQMSKASDQNSNSNNFALSNIIVKLCSEFELYIDGVKLCSAFWCLCLTSLV